MSSFILHSVILHLSFHISGIHSTVNIATHGEIWYCNSNPSQKVVSISPLSAYDLQRIDKLEQVQIMTRHGTRTSHYNFQDYFPNSTQYYHCNISTVTSRMYNNNEYLIPMLQTFESNNQLLLNSNCEMEQSMPTLITQMQQNTQIFIDAYMHSNENPSQLFDIRSITNTSNAHKYFKFYTSNKERCMLTTLVIASELFKNLSLPNIETVTNDFEFNPYAPWENTMCNAKAQFKEWHNQSTTDIFQNYIIPKRERLFASQKYKTVMRDYAEQGGITVNDTYSFHEHPGFRIGNFYCNGLDLPLTNDTFWSLVEIGKEYSEIFPLKSSADTHEHSFATKYECIYRFMSLPMYARFLDNILEITNGERNAKRFVLHSAHDSSIMAFLDGLGMSDGSVPYFAQFMSLELYSSNSAQLYNEIRHIRYLFRFTHKGRFVPYEYCESEYINNGPQMSELCDLNVLLKNGFKGVNMTQREWANHRCGAMIDDCVCGYCTAIQTNERSNHWIFEAESFGIGLLSGVLITLLFVFGVKEIIIIKHYFCCCGKSNIKRRHGYQETCESEDGNGSEIEMIGGTANDIYLNS